MARGRGQGRWAERGEPPAATDVAAWFTGRLPAEWFTGPPEITVDREEITVVGSIPEPEADEAGQAAARAGRANRFREETRGARMTIADEAEARYGRSVAWGVRIGDEVELFTNLSVPVMTRLRQPERRVLDTLVDSGVARSRSDALAWCVRLVGDNTEAWLGRLREAMEQVEQVRAEGPAL
jgi:hypothetical protein